MYFVVLTNVNNANDRILLVTIFTWCLAVIIFF